MLPLGETNNHLFHAKFFQQYRLFFRYHLASKIIVYAWVMGHWYWTHPDYYLHEIEPEYLLQELSRAF